jgi:GTP-binding protein Era
MTFLSGFVAIVGPPNVGKSTLLNQLLGTKVAIVSPKPQTTRNRILGIVHGEGYQIVFMDTPGIHQTHTPLHESMVASASAAFQEVDIIALVVEMPHPQDKNISTVLRNLKKVKKPSLLVINKVDLAPKEAVLPVIESYRRRYPFKAFLPVSALKGEGLEALVEELKSLLKPGPMFFPPDMKTDQSEFFLISEIIREKIYYQMRRELPYACAVTVDSMQEEPAKNLLSISAKIHVETESQKGIVIGAGGKMIKNIGRSSRLDIERVFGTPVFLELRVRVDKRWSRNPKALRKLGY